MAIAKYIVRDEFSGIVVAFGTPASLEKFLVGKRPERWSVYRGVKWMPGKKGLAELRVKLEGPTP